MAHSGIRQAPIAPEPRFRIRAAWQSDCCCLEKFRLQRRPFRACYSCDNRWTIITGRVNDKCVAFFHALCRFRKSRAYVRAMRDKQAVAHFGRVPGLSLQVLCILRAGTFHAITAEFFLRDNIIKPREPRSFQSPVSWTAEHFTNGNLQPANGITDGSRITPTLFIKLAFTIYIIRIDRGGIRYYTRRTGVTHYKDETSLPQRLNKFHAGEALRTRLPGYRQQAKYRKQFTD
jgi:hypothetical protein